MKLHLSIDLKKLVQDMRGPKGASALTEEFLRISSELKKFKEEITPEAKAQLKRAEAQGQVLLKQLKKAQKDLEKEVKARISHVKIQAKNAELQVEKLKGLAVAQKAKIEKKLQKNLAPSRKKFASPKAGRKNGASMTSTKTTKSPAKKKSVRKTSTKSI